MLNLRQPIYVFLVKRGYFEFKLVTETYISRPGSVKADILVKTIKDGGDSVQKTLQDEINKAKLGTIPVDRYLYSFKQTQGTK